MKSLNKLKKNKETPPKPTIKKQTSNWPSLHNNDSRINKIINDRKRKESHDFNNWWETPFLRTVNNHIIKML